MKNRIFTRLTALVFFAAVLTLAFAADSLAQGDKSGNVKTTIAQVHVISTGAVVPQAGATLSRNNDGLFGHISTSGLAPGHVATMWWVIFNHAEFCATTVCTPPDLNNPLVNGALQFGGGIVVGAGGRADFSSYLAEGDNSGFYLNPAFPNMPNPSPGVVDAKTVQIHMAVRDHGPASADPAVLALQLTTFPGGCSMANPCTTLHATPFLP